MMKTYTRRAGIEIVHADVGDVEQDFAARAKGGTDQIFHDFLLAVDRYRFSGQRSEVDTMPSAVETQFDAGMTQSFALQALA